MAKTLPMSPEDFRVRQQAWELEMKTEAASNVVARWAGRLFYNPSRADDVYELFIEFHSGAVYYYEDLPRPLFNLFVNGPSKGRAVNAINSAVRRGDVDYVKLYDVGGIDPGPPPTLDEMVEREKREEVSVKEYWRELESA